ncbi:MAG: hypothetical protein ABIA11_01775 [Patescibacteria group bacterium]
MGITIHYKGKAKSLEAIDGLIENLKEVAITFRWDYKLIDEEVKGELLPSWGHGYGYIPPKEDMEKEGIEFFPKMISYKCNGYFRIWNSRYTKEVRKAFRRGKSPGFSINTRKKGIWLDVHPKCEILEFTFDVNTLELAGYQKYDHSPGVIYGYDGFFCKTQYAGLQTHILVCKIIKLAEKYIDFSNINDEGDFYHSQDIETARKAFGESTAMIESFGKILKEAGKKMGLRVVAGDEM